MAGGPADVALPQKSLKSAEQTALSARLCVFFVGSKSTLIGVSAAKSLFAGKQESLSLMVEGEKVPQRGATSPLYSTSLENFNAKRKRYTTLEAAAFNWPLSCFLNIGECEFYFFLNRPI